MEKTGSTDGTVQRKDDGGSPEVARVHSLAAQGTQTRASLLPHRDVSQRAFGRHDVSTIETHTNTEAAASAKDMGAVAYATGNHVVLGKGADLFTEAHEATHVVQQRGGVHLKEGVGQASDRYETHADAVVSVVVRGESAESLLDQVAGVGGQTSTYLQ